MITKLEYGRISLFILSFFIFGFSAPSESKDAPSVFSLGLTLGKSEHSSNLLSSATGVEVFLIRRYNKYVSLDWGYIYFGKMEGPTFSDGNINLTSTAQFSGISSSIIFDYPTNQKYTPFIKTGYSMISLVVEVESIAASASAKGSSTNFFYGTGVKYNIADNLQLILMLENYLLGSGKNITFLSSGLLLSLD